MSGDRLGIAAAIALIAIVRLLPVLSGDGFPAGDGGLFAVMATELRDAFPWFPFRTSYNDAAIPFSYPPLGPIVLAAVPGSPIGTEILLVAAVSLGSVVAFYLAARTVLSNPASALVATFVFGLLPNAWLSLGGDSVRGVFLLLLLLAVWRTWHLVANPTLPGLLLVGLICGLALLSHPIAWTVLPVSLGVVWAAHPSRRGVLGLLGAAGVAALVVGPWLVLVVSRHGADPFLSAAVSHGTAPLALRALRFGLSGFNGPDVVGAFAILGLMLASHRGPRFVPLWFAALLITPGAELRTLAAPVALAIGILISELVAKAPPMGRVIPAVAAVGSAAALGFAALTTFATSSDYGVVSPEDRAAAEWMRRSLDPASRVAIISADSNTSVEEWLPALSSLHSVGTYQGSEWLPSAEWERRLEANRQLRGCRSRQCIPEEATVLFVSSDVDTAIAGLAAPDYAAGARVFRLRSTD